jgi:16S rRNA pseudouridine516 synthase
MRLDQFLQKTLGVSRQDARSILKGKKVVVNGEVVKQAKHQLDLSQDRVFYCNDELVYQEFFYFMLNKPKGFVSSHTHDGGTPIYDLLEDYSFVDLHCTGRLDVDTTGLVLVTNDGQGSHRVAHPNQNCFKRYLVTLAEDITPLSIQQLEEGAELHEGKALPSCNSAPSSNC